VRVTTADLGDAKRLVRSIAMNGDSLPQIREIVEQDERGSTSNVLLSSMAALCHPADGAAGFKLVSPGGGRAALVRSRVVAALLPLLRRAGRSG
jgi:hypothetical protein